VSPFKFREAHIFPCIFHISCLIVTIFSSPDPSPLIPYVKALGLKYHYIRDEIGKKLVWEAMNCCCWALTAFSLSKVERASCAGRDGKLVSSLCAYCARMKRGNLYACARANNCNKLVLAQHLDDLAESFMMSVMHNGFLRTMKANYKINAGDLSVIRPLVYCREALMTEFARKANLPVINENCPACFEEPKERARMKKLLSKEPDTVDSIETLSNPIEPALVGPLTVDDRMSFGSRLDDCCIHLIFSFNCLIRSSIDVSSLGIIRRCVRSRCCS
jgi:hypothetical protein